MEIVVDVGDGQVRDFEMTATKAGRRVEIAVARGTVEVSEVTRTGEPVRSARFMATRVVALVEHPAAGASGGGGAGERTTRRRSPGEPLPLHLEE